ncbi:hypothetical protein D3C81_1145760 [compost metagenome]
MQIVQAFPAGFEALLFGMPGTFQQVQQGNLSCGRSPIGQPGGLIKPPFLHTVVADRDGGYGMETKGSSVVAMPVATIAGFI